MRPESINENIAREDKSESCDYLRHADETHIHAAILYMLYLSFFACVSPCAIYTYTANLSVLLYNIDITWCLYYAYTIACPISILDLVDLQILYECDRPGEQHVS